MRLNEFYNQIKTPPFSSAWRVAAECYFNEPSLTMLKREWGFVHPNNPISLQIMCREEDEDSYNESYSVNIVMKIVDENSRLFISFDVIKDDYDTVEVCGLHEVLPREIYTTIYERID